MIVVIDASVALKWFLRDSPEEDHADRALGLLEQIASGTIRMVQPPHFVAEVAAVLARLKPQEALVDLMDLLQIESQTEADPEIYAVATELAIRYQHHVFDTLYHALALHTPGAQLITADRRYFEKARGEGAIRLLSAVE